MSSMSMFAQSCPGLYCGRAPLPRDPEDLGDAPEWGECGACPRGSRANLTGYCAPCDGRPPLYDWMYLGFMALLALVLHWFFIDTVAKGRRFTRTTIALHACALLEVAASAHAALLLVEPAGALDFRACRVQSLSDWYTVLHNPTPNYEETLHCTHEAVYPLYTLVLLMYGFSVMLVVLMRCIIAPLLFDMPHYSTLAVYSALYFYPILVTTHALAAGLIYYSYPYIIIILSMMSSASYFSLKSDQSTLALVASSFSDVRNFVILVGHWFLHAYGIVAITGLREPALHGALLLLVPAPAAFYVLTARFTDPVKVHLD